MITIDDLKKCGLRVGKVREAERIEGSRKLLKLKVDMGDETRQIIAGIGITYEPEGMVGKEIIIVTNLEPRSLMGFESQGMLLAATDESGEPVLILPERDVPPGNAIR